MFLRSEFRDVHFDYSIKAMFNLSLPPVVCRRVRVLITLFVFAHVLWCPTHLVLCFCFSSSMLPVSLDCPFVIAPSVLSNVYVQ